MLYKLYPTNRGVMYPIKNMSKSYLIQTIDYIRKSGRNEQYLPELLEELKIKSLITFKLLKDD